MVQLFRVLRLNRAFKRQEIILPFVIQTTPKYSFCELTNGVIFWGSPFEILLRKSTKKILIDN